MRSAKVQKRKFLIVIQTSLVFHVHLTLDAIHIYTNIYSTLTFTHQLADLDIHLTGDKLIRYPELDQWKKKHNDIIVLNDLLIK